MSKTPAQLDAEIAETLRVKPTKKTAKRATRVHIIGLRDGLDTAATGFYRRKLRALGATVTLTKTGRATVRDASGNVTIYTVAFPQNRAEADALLATNPDPESPLSRAYADLTR